MFEIENLLSRRTVKNFSAEKIPAEILANATRVAHRAPTSLNSRPVILLEISSRRNDEWIAHQKAVASAPHIFLFAVNPEVGEMNARKFLAGRFDEELGGAKVDAMIAKIVANRDEWARQQIYLTAGFFAATLETAGATGCFVAGFDKKVATVELNLPENYSAELIFAAGFPNPENDGSTPTDFVRKFNDFYFPEKN